MPNVSSSVPIPVVQLCLNTPVSSVVTIPVIWLWSYYTCLFPGRISCGPALVKSHFSPHRFHFPSYTFLFYNSISVVGIHSLSTGLFSTDSISCLQAPFSDLISLLSFNPPIPFSYIQHNTYYACHYSSNIFRSSGSCPCHLFPDVLVTYTVKKIIVNFYTGIDNAD